MATKTLRITLADILEPAGPSGRVHGEVWARYVDANGAPREIHYTDGTVVTMAQARVALNASGVAEFVVVPNDDATVVAADRGFGIQVGWDLTQRGTGGAKLTITNAGRTVSVTSASPSVVQYGLLDTYVPIIAGTTYVTQSTADVAYAPKLLVQSLSAFAPLKAALAAPAADRRSCGIQVLGDSTGNDPTDWPYRLAQAIAPLFPTWNVHHRLWDDTTQLYGANTVIQAAAAGPRYLDCSTGTTTRRLDASVSPYLSGVIDVRVKVSMADWTPATQAVFCGKSSADPQRGWYFGVNSAGLLFFAHSTDGNAATLTSTFNNTAANAWVDGQTYWVRCIFNPNNGSSQRTYDFKVSTDGVTWTSVGSQVVVAGAITVFNNSATGYELGGVAAGIGNAGAKIYEIQIRNGLDGPNVVPAIPDLWPPYSSAAAYFGGAPNLTFVNGSRAGAEIGYLGDSTRLPKLTPNYGQLVTFLSDSHNEGLYVQRSWINRYDTWRAAVEAQLPGVPFVILTQNPEASAAQISPGTTWYREHAQRRQDLLGYARQKRYDLIDTYQAFLDAGWPGALMQDPVHPNATGSDLWRDVVLARFNAS